MTDFQRIERPRVVVTRKLLPAIEARMAELFDCRFNDDDHDMTRDELVAAMQDCDILVPTVTDRIDADVIAAAPASLKMIANFGAGVNHIDLAAAKAKGILVTNTPGVFTDDTADLTMALDPERPAPSGRRPQADAQRRMERLGADWHARPPRRRQRRWALSALAGSARRLRCARAPLA